MPQGGSWANYTDYCLCDKDESGDDEETDADQNNNEQVEEEFPPIMN